MLLASLLAINSLSLQLDYNEMSRAAAIAIPAPHFHPV